MVMMMHTATMMMRPRWDMVVAVDWYLVFDLRCLRFQSFSGKLST